MMKYLIFLFAMTIWVSALQAQQGVGIGTATPNANAVLELSSTTKGFLLPRMTTLQRGAIPNTAGLMVYDTDFKEYYHNDGAGWKKLLNSSFWNSSSTRNWVYNSSDSIGIGTSSPDQKLHLASGKFYIQDNRSGQSPHIIFDNPAVDYKEGGLQWHRSGDTMASIDYIAHPNFANFIRLRAGDKGMYFNSNGHLGIGWADPQTTFHLRNPDATDDMIRIDGINPTIRFTKKTGSIIPTWTEVGFVGTTDDKDLRIGTYSGNTTGKFIVRTDGVDRVHVTGLGMGIGTAIPLTNLHLQGGADAGLAVGDNGYAMMGSAVSGGTNLIIDNNEIMVRSGYTSPSTLTLQNDGGNVNIGAYTSISAGLALNTSGEALKINGTNPYVQLYSGGIARFFMQQNGAHLTIANSNGNSSGNLVLGGSQITIGQITPAVGYKLSIDGKAICEELKVQLKGNWPDYVFANDYKLRSLDELQSFINTNKHLPGIPAASELEKNGMEVGDMQKRMMEKIEELTLYILDLQKQIDDLKAKNTATKSSL
jgi:hypothetical protein